MAQEVGLAALAGEDAKRSAQQVYDVLSVDKVALQLVSTHRAHLTAALAKALSAELVRPSEAIHDVAATNTGST